MVTSKVSEADVPRLQADVGPSSLRYVCLDFETNGFPEKNANLCLGRRTPYKSASLRWKTARLFTCTTPTSRVRSLSTYG